MTRSPMRSRRFGPNSGDAVKETAADRDVVKGCGARHDLLEHHVINADGTIANVPLPTLCCQPLANA